MIIEPNDDDLDLLDDGMEALVMEMAALEALFEANKGEGPADRAIVLCQQAYEARTSPPQTVEQIVVRAALARVLGEPAPDAPLPLSAQRTWTKIVYDATAAAWLDWVAGGKSGEGLTARLRRNEPDTENVPDGAVELLALAEWGKAVEALVQDDLATAKRHFERAIEIGSQVGSDSNPSINWTYAASFFSR